MPPKRVSRAASSAKASADSDAGRGRQASPLRSPRSANNRLGTASPRLGSKENVIAQQFSGDIPDFFDGFQGEPIVEDAGVPPIGGAFFGPPGSSPRASVIRAPKGWPDVRKYIRQKFTSDRQVFKSLDLNNNGTLSMTELKQGLERLQVPWRSITGQERFYMVIKGVQDSLQKNSFGQFTYEDLFPDDGNTEKRRSIGPDRDLNDLVVPPARKYVHTEIQEIQEFAKWAAKGNRWDILFDLFHDMPSQKWNLNSAETSLKKQPCTLTEWTRKLKYMQYPAGNAVEIFKEIQLEFKTLQDQAKRDKYGDPLVDSILISQLLVFKRRAMGLNAQLGTFETGSALQRMLTHLKRLADGCLLRGWRLFIDTHGAGKVSEKDFARALKKMKMNHELGTIWRSLRPSRTDLRPVQFHEICPTEAQNLERFATVFFRHCGGNVEVGWGILDHQAHNYLGQDEFERACERIGFTGDAKAVFKGLGDVPSNRVTKTDMDYLTRVTQICQAKMSDVPAALREFTMWVAVTFGSPESFISKLGLSDRNPAISVSDLSARLIAMGYSGDALSVSCRASRLEGGTHISAPSLHLLLNGAHRSEPIASHRSPPLVKSSEKMPLSERPDWNSSGYDQQIVHNLGQSKNFPTPRGQRMYFSVPERSEEELEKKTYAIDQNIGPPNAANARAADPAAAARSRSAPASARSPRRPSVVRREEVLHLRGKGLVNAENVFKRDPLLESHIARESDWNSSIVDFSKLNDCQCKKMKDVFIEDFHRPQKDALNRQIKETREKRQQERANANREMFLKPWSSKFDFLTPGEKVLIRLQEIMDGPNQVRARDLVMFDVHQRGRLHKDELGEGLASLGFDLTADQLNSMFKMVDTDGSGDIDPKEFMRCMRKTVKRAEKRILGENSRSATPRSCAGNTTPRLTPRSLTPR